jgi:DNA mismatch repair protein MutL
MKPLNVIQLLPDSIANQIAAGEVVQRPASVVKELLENSVDAGAKTVQLIVREAGRNLVQVIDDGSGMSETDARMCFERHATSKIRTSDDLFKIKTMGFRGEAMASIAAVAQVEMRTRRAEDELGTLIRIEGSEFKGQEAVSCLPGTNTLIKNLFFNVPARRNFLKSNSVEMRHVLDEFQRVALANPAVGFSLFHNDQEVYSLPGGKLSRRIVDMFGKNYREQLAQCDEETPYVSVRGYIGKPEFARKTRAEQFFFANNRFIKHNYLHHAVTAAYESTIPAGAHPFYVLFVDIDPSHIDINIHPTKTEIKFDDERSVYGIVMAAVRRALGIYNLSPSLDFDADVNFLTGGHGRDTSDGAIGRAAAAASVGATAAKAVAAVAATLKSRANTASAPAPPPEAKQPRPVSPSWSGFDKAAAGQIPADWADAPAPPADGQPDPGKPVNPVARPVGLPAAAPEPTENLLFPGSAPGDWLPAPHPQPAAVPAPGPSAGSVSGSVSGLSNRLGFSPDELSGQNPIQLQNRYLLLPVKSGVLVVDQRAAFERILYDQFQAALHRRDGASQQLLFPKTVTLMPADAQLALELRDELTNLGFQFDELGANAFVLRGVPTLTTDENEEDLFGNLLARLREETARSRVKFDRPEALARSLARRSAGRHLTRLGADESRSLLERWLASANPAYTPGGEPIAALWPVEKIAGLFRP